RQSNTPWEPRFVWEGKKLFQNSTMSPDVRWEIPQTLDTIDPASPHYNAKSRYAKTLRRDGETWGDVPGKPLIPALSPSEGERENRNPSPGESSRRESSVRVQINPNRATASPLPLGGGEGQG